MLNILSKVADNFKIVSNKKRSSGGNRPTIHTMPGQGGFQLSEQGLSAIRCSRADYVVLAQLAEGFAEYFKGTPPTRETNNGPIYYMLYKGATVTDADGNVTDSVGSKISLVGLNGQFSSVMAWEGLGGNEELKQVYDLGERIYGFAAMGESLIPVTAETDVTLEVDGVLVLSGDTNESVPLVQVDTIQEALDLNRPLFVLEFLETQDKIARTASAPTADVPAKTGGKKEKAAETINFGDIEG